MESLGYHSLKKLFIVTRRQRVGPRSDSVRVSNPISQPDLRLSSLSRLPTLQLTLTQVSTAQARPSYH